MADENRPPSIGYPHSDDASNRVLQQLSAVPTPQPIGTPLQQAGYQTAWAQQAQRHWQPAVLAAQQPMSTAAEHPAGLARSQGQVQHSGMPLLYQFSQQPVQQYPVQAASVSPDQTHQPRTGQKRKQDILPQVQHEHCRSYRYYYRTVQSCRSV